MSTRILPTGIAICFLASASLTIAAEPVQVDTVGQTIDNSVQYEIADGFSMRMSMTDYRAFESTDDHNTFSTMTGPCFGEIEQNQGELGGDGFCVWHDGAGDKLVILWAPTGVDEDGDLVGIWHIVQGLGKWHDADGEGDWKYHVDEGSSEGANQISGTIRFAD